MIIICCDKCGVRILNHQPMTRVSFVDSPNLITGEHVFCSICWEKMTEPKETINKVYGKIGTEGGYYGAA